MRKTFLALVAVAACAACGSNPVGPSRLQEQFSKKSPQLTATDEAGNVVYVCSTKPRQYVSPDGVSTWEVDHYISQDPCPATPID